MDIQELASEQQAKLGTLAMATLDLGSRTNLVGCYFSSSCSAMLLCNVGSSNFSSQLKAFDRLTFKLHTANDKLRLPVSKESATISIVVLSPTGRLSYLTGSCLTAAAARLE